MLYPRGLLRHALPTSERKRRRRADLPAPYERRDPWLLRWRGIAARDDNAPYGAPNARITLKVLPAQPHRFMPRSSGAATSPSTHTTSMAYQQGSCPDRTTRHARKSLASAGFRLEACRVDPQACWTDTAGRPPEGTPYPSLPVRDPASGKRLFRAQASGIGVLRRNAASNWRSVRSARERPTTHASRGPGASGSRDWKRRSRMGADAAPAPDRVMPSTPATQDAPSTSKATSLGAGDPAPGSPFSSAMDARTGVGSGCAPSLTGTGEGEVSVCSGWSWPMA